MNNSKNKIKVAVLMGGISSEHDVSMMSGREIVKNLNQDKYEVVAVVISKDGKGIERIIEVKPDIAFIALHGKGGEDGKIQGFLKSVGIPYTGSGVLASAIGMDKIVFRKLMQVESMPIPKYFTVTKNNKTLLHDFGPPYFVKPYNGGSSVGVSFVKEQKDLDKAMELAFEQSETVLVDEYVKGMEINCGVIGNNDPKALPAIEIRPLKGEFFDYKSKYEKGGSEEIAPARISEDVTRMIQEMAVKVYKVVGCSGYARVDFILKDDKDPVILEINTLPGMTSESLLPKEAKAAGISYEELLDKIIGYGLEKKYE